MGVYSVEKLMTEARRLAAEYRKTTGKPLAISNEIALFDAARLLNLETPEVPATGYDMIGQGQRAGLRIQIKARAVFDESKSGQRIGQLKLDQEWDLVMLVLMDENYEPSEIHEAERAAVVGSMGGQEDSQRNKRGAMSIARFKHLSRLVWTREEGEITDELWEN